MNTATRNDPKVTYIILLRFRFQCWTDPFGNCIIKGESGEDSSLCFGAIFQQNSEWCMTFSLAQHGPSCFVWALILKGVLVQLLPSRPQMRHRMAHMVHSAMTVWVHHPWWLEAGRHDSSKSKWWPQHPSIIDRIMVACSVMFLWSSRTHIMEGANNIFN